MSLATTYHTTTITRPLV